MPDQKLNLSISDPVSADIQAGCAALQSLCEFLCTPEGQASCKAWRDSSTAWNTAIEKAGAWIEGIFKGVSL